ncbi:D-alanyl-D-alanine carboxypeptidase/D-alanyl-D-alanine endopeptidase [Virgisporangium aurantiacum]|nr:D-alanyl-D-alanine carboxypeptidase/D-alanyl-D-alanine-endopeptidase [Virgisporangium aurantiacum]
MARRPRKFMILGLALATVGAIGAAAPPPAGALPSAAGIVDTLDRILADPRLAGVTVGLEVRDTADGSVIYSRNAGQRLVPASNNKLLTSVAALEVLGTDHRFHTRVLGTGRQRGPVLAGDLYLKGGGDPTLLAGDYDALAKTVADSGIRLVTGRLIADDTWFDANRLGHDWATDDEPQSYAASISGLTVAPDTDYDPGAVIIEARPGAVAGQPAALSVVPAVGDVTLVNRATTGPAGSANTLSFNREHGTNTFVVSGSTPVGAAVSRDYMAVWNPTSYAATIFREALKRHGVRVQGSTGYGATPAGATERAAHESMTLGELLVPFLKLSNNMHAEVLLKEMGRAAAGQGSWAAGLAAASGALTALGVDMTVQRQVDGSGLSRQDLLTNHQITTLLLAARAEPWYQTWYDALPIAGVSERMVGGTLRSRMVGTPAAGNVHAKTGTLTGVSALSGYVTDANGRKLVFSMINNNSLGGVSALLDAVAVALASPQNAAASANPPGAGGGPSSTGDEVECSWVKTC